MPDDDDDLGPQEPICVFCWPYRLANGDIARDCFMCVARGSDRWCECTYCPWLDEENP